MEKVDIVLITEFFPISEEAGITGGVESRFFFLIKEISMKKKIIVLCSRQPGQPKESYVFGAKVIRCGPETPYSNSGNIFKRVRTAVSWYTEGKRLNAKVVEAGSFLAYIPTYLIGKKIKAHKVATWHETWIGEWVKNKGLMTGIFGSFWERLSLRLKWDEIISVSEFTKERLVKRGIKESKIRVIPNGIDFEKISQLKAEKEINPMVCYFGRLNWQKNLDVLIKAVAEVKKEIPDLKCKIMGGGPALEELKKLTNQLRLNETVIYTGYFQDYNEMLKEAKKCQLFVQPSTLEGFGITVLEAMACNLPCILSDIPPFKEIMQEEGVFFKEEKDLSKEIINLLKDKKKYNLILTKQAQIVKEYDWKKISEKWLNSVL